MKTKPEEKAHSELGGSSAYRYMNCSGSVQLMKQHNLRSAETEHTKSGTLAHKLAELALSEFLELKRTNSIRNPQFQKLAEESDQELVQFAKDWREYMWEKVFHSFLTDKAYWIEKKFFFNEKFDMFGTADLAVIYTDDSGKRVGVVADFKSGYYEVEAKNNAQLFFYANALADWFQKKTKKKLDYVRMVIFQPKSETPYKEAKATWKQLQAWKKKLTKPAFQLYVEKKPKFKVGDWCKFCPAQTHCTKYSNDLIASTNLEEIKDVTIEPNLPTPERLSDDVLARVVLYASRLEKFIKECKRYAINRATNGAPLPGLKVIERAGRRSWLECEDKIAKALIKMGLEDPYQRKLLPFGQVEKELGKGKIDKFLRKNRGSLALVPEDDERPAAKLTADLLEDYEDEDE